MAMDHVIDVFWVLSAGRGLFVLARSAVASIGYDSDDLPCSCRSENAGGHFHTSVSACVYVVSYEPQ